MKNSRLMRAVGVTVLAALALAGCTGETTVDPSPTAPNPSGKGTDGIGEPVDVTFTIDGADIPLTLTANEVSQGADRDLEYLDDESRAQTVGMSPYYVTFTVEWDEKVAEELEGIQIAESLWPTYNNGRIGQKLLIQDGEFPDCNALPLTMSEEPEDGVHSQTICIIGLISEGETQALSGGAYLQEGGDEPVIWTP